MLSKLKVLVLIVAGPAAIGAITGLAEGPQAVLGRAAALPAVLLGLSILMIPALYICSALLGAAPSSSTVYRGGRDALMRTGVALLGLAPPVALLTAATADPPTSSWIALVTTGLAVLLGLRVFFMQFWRTGEPAAAAKPTYGAGSAVRAAPRSTLAGVVMYTVWSVVSLGIGARLMVQVLAI